jgi:hypothetical protein
MISTSIVHVLWVDNIHVGQIAQFVHMWHLHLVTLLRGYFSVGVDLVLFFVSYFLYRLLGFNVGMEWWGWCFGDVEGWLRRLIELLWGELSFGSVERIWILLGFCEIRCIVIPHIIGKGDGILLIPDGIFLHVIACIFGFLFKWRLCGNGIALLKVYIFQYLFNSRPFVRSNPQNGLDKIDFWMIYNLYSHY